MARVYIKTGAERRQKIEEWYRARRLLGTQKEFAARLGLSEARVQQIVGEIRARDRNEDKSRKLQLNMFPDNVILPPDRS